MTEIFCMRLSRDFEKLAKFLLKCLCCKKNEEAHLHQFLSQEQVTAFKHFYAVVV